MAADVSCLVRVMNGMDSNESGKSTYPITRDLLGESLHSKELDLDFKVPSGWEKRLDLQSGKVYFQRCNSSNSSNPETKAQSSKTWAIPVPLQTLNLFNDSILDLKLVSSSSSSNYQSVCTLDKVKSALERAEKETLRKRSISTSKSTSPRSNSSYSWIKDCEVDQEENSASFAAGCLSCLTYVLISKSNPMCPRCNSNVPLPVNVKKPLIDLNISI